MRLSVPLPVVVVNDTVCPAAVSVTLKPLTKTVEATILARPDDRQVVVLHALSESLNFASTVALIAIDSVTVAPAPRATLTGAAVVARAPLKKVFRPVVGLVAGLKLTVPANPLRLVSVPVAKTEAVLPPFAMLTVSGDGVTVQE